MGDQVKVLRQTTLNLAVRGKLVEQDSTHEPASKLLKQIETEKAQLIEARKVRRIKAESISADTSPFQISDPWAWSRFGAIGDWGSGSTPPRSNPDNCGGGITWPKSGELNDERRLNGSEETMSEFAVAKGSFRRSCSGDVLIAMYGATIGKVAILAEEAFTNQAVCGCTPFTGVFNGFLLLSLLARRPHFQSASEGGAQPNISNVKIVASPFPLPPLAEQHRIVAKATN